MSKKKIKIIVLIFLGVVIGGGGLYFWKFRSTNKVATTESQEVVGEEGDGIGQTVPYSDTSGFSFLYPENVEVSDETPDDPAYYTLLKLSKGDESLTISVMDVDQKTVASFLASSDKYKKAELYGAVSLGSMKAEQYSLEDKLITLTIDQGVLYLVEGPKDGGFWEETQTVVDESFAFGDTAKQSSSSGSSGVVYEGEEVVE